MRRFFVAALAIAAVSTNAQTYFPMKEGAVLEYKYLDDKGKPMRNEFREERYTRFTVDKVWGDSVANVSIEEPLLKRFANWKSLSTMVEDVNYGDVRVRSNGVVTENLQMMMPYPEIFPRLNSEEENIRFKVDVEAASQLPRELKAGDELPEERYRWTFSSYLAEDADDEIKEQMLDMMDAMAKQMDAIGLKSDKPTNLVFAESIVVPNRKVVGMETVETPAGKFKCWKITWEMVGPSERMVGMPTREEIEEAVIALGGNASDVRGMRPSNSTLLTEYVDYVSPEIGLVRREKRNFRGNKIEETIELTTYKR